MSNKNFMAYGDAETVLTGFANDIKTKASEAGTESLINSTVGWTGKNLLKNTASSTTINGVTFTVNANKSVTVSTEVGGATAYTQIYVNADIYLNTGDYIISNGLQTSVTGLNTNLYNITDDITVVGFGSGEAEASLVSGKKYGLRIIVSNGTIITNPVTLSPMLRDSRITDPTYEPYHKSVEECLEDINDKLSYLEQTVTLSTSASTTVTFTDSSITANSFIEYACSQWDLVPESITGAAGSCTIVLPKVDSAQSVTVRIYVR